MQVSGVSWFCLALGPVSGAPPLPLGPGGFSQASQALSMFVFSSSFTPKSRVCACVRASVRACMWVCGVWVCACVCASMCVKGRCQVTEASSPHPSSSSRMCVGEELIKVRAGVEGTVQS